MRRITATFAILTLLGGAVLPYAAPALDAYEGAYQTAQASSDIPLVVIRFNQPRVMYERQLYNAVSKAISIKPSVVFDVVSFVPQTGRSERDEQAEKASLSQVSGVVNTLRGMGIPQERMHVTSENSPSIGSHEVHIYVE